MSKYYINYDEQATINYCFLFCLYCISAKDNNNKLSNTIIYKNLNELSATIKSRCNYNISVSTISRILKDTDRYKNYFIVNTAKNTITLNNNFRKGSAASNKFITLSDKEINFLIAQDNKLLNKYYLYLKYYCGYSKSKQIDTTANQILSAIGYSNNCGNNKNNLCKFNSLLTEQGFITISKFKDEKGFCRNLYRMSL